MRSSRNSTPCWKRICLAAVVFLYSTLTSHGWPGSYGATALQVGERLLRALLDQLARPRGDDHPRARLADALLDGDRRQAVAEELLALAAGRLVAGDEQHRAAPRAAERGVDARLADLRPVEPEVLPGLARDRVVEHAVGGAGHRVHADEERRVAALLEEAGVLRPLLLDDVLARGVEVLGDQRVEGVALAGAVAVHDDDLGRPGRLRTADGRVDLPGVELASLLEHGPSRVRLVALDDPADALHVADDVNAHARNLPGTALSGARHRTCPKITRSRDRPSNERGTSIEG